MRPEIEELNNRWDDFICKCQMRSYEVNEQDVTTYSSLMAATFKILKKEWKDKMVHKDIALLFATIGSLSTRQEEDGNVLGSEEYERLTLFNGVFITNLFRSAYFNFDERGKLLLESYNVTVLRIDPDTFVIPSADEIYGI